MIHPPTWAMPLRRFSTILLLAAVVFSPVHAQAVEIAGRNVDIELGLGGWLSQGETRWNHDNSRLVYKDNGTNIIELSGKVTFNKRVFVRANYGFGDIGGGRLTDDDFDNPNGPVNVSTHSDIKGNDTWYVNGDVGATVLHFPNQRGSLSVFGGIQYWRQQYQAVGVVQDICNPGTLPCNPANNGVDLAPGQKAITNTTTWTSVKLGIESEYRFTRRFRVEGKAAFIPFTSLSNKDVHHLRTTDVVIAPGVTLPALQQDTSFKMTGTGIGANLEAAASYMVINRLYLSLGYRFWWNRVTDGTIIQNTVNFGSSSTKLQEFQTWRHGMTLGVTYIF